MEYGYLSTALIRPLVESVEADTFTDLEFEEHALLRHVKDPDGRIQRQSAEKLITWLINKQQDNSLCVKPSQQFYTHSSCQLQHLFLCCNTLREALYYLEKFSVLLCDRLEIQVTRTRDNIIKVKLPVREQVIDEVDQHRIEIILGTLMSWLKQLCGPTLEIRQVVLPYSAPDYVEQYESAWQTHVEFDQDECSIQFHSHWLDEGLHNTNPHILKMMKREVEEQYRKLARSGSLADRIRKALLQNKIRLNANQQEVAEYFHISARTLNRHLHKEETSLKQIVTDVRIEMAKRLLLSSEDSIEQIALHIGLSGRRTLDRIFIKELQQSPAQFRQQHREHDSVNIARIA